MIVKYDEENFSIKLYRDFVKGKLVGLMEVIPIDELLEVWADRKTEPQTMVYPQVDGITPSVIEPQTDGYMTAEQAEDYRKMLDKAEHKVYGNIEDEPQDCLTCRYNSDEWDSPKCDGCSKAYSNYEPQTDCSWK